MTFTALLTGFKNSVVDFKSHTSFSSRAPAVEMDVNDNGWLSPRIIDSLGVPMCQIIIYLLTKMWRHFWLRGALWWMQGDQSLFSTQTVKAFSCLFYCLMNGLFYTLSVCDEKTHSEVLHKCSVLYQWFSQCIMSRGTAVTLVLHVHPPTYR